MNLQSISAHDRATLRELARKRLEMVESAVNRERRQAWYALDSGAGARPMVLAEVGGVANEVFKDLQLVCESETARRFERDFRIEEYIFTVLQDDHVLEPWINVGWQVSTTDYGVEVVNERVAPSQEGQITSRHWDPPIKDLDADFAKLRPREFKVDREGTYARKEFCEEIFADILPVRIRGGYWWTLGMTQQAIYLTGLENLMLSMYENPDGLHRLMKFLHDDYLAYAVWLEAENLLCLNNENDYIGSGSMGYTRRLPQTDRQAAEPVRSRDMWVLLESQETVGVGPNQFAEFIFPYQLDLARRFGLCYYGCCEPVDSRWQVLKQIPNLERVSVSPWSDQEKAAAFLGRDYVFSRKPNPTLVSTGTFAEDLIRQDLRQTLEHTVANRCRLEIIMKDVHTLNNEPERLPRWVQLAREEIARHS